MLSSDSPFSRGHCPDLVAWAAVVILRARLIINPTASSATEPEFAPGVLVTNIDNDRLRDDFAGYVKYLPNRDYGPNLHPVQAITTLNDMRTLRSKVDMMSRNTMQVATFLAEHPAVERVDYLGLPDHPRHELASKYMWLVDAEYDELYKKPVNRYGHLLSFGVKGGPERARSMFDRLQRIWRATDLGRIKSVATIPAISTHQQQGEAGRQLADIPPNLVRLCVGGEHPDDVIADLDQALTACAKS